MPQAMDLAVAPKRVMVRDVCGRWKEEGLEMDKKVCGRGRN